MRLTFSLFSLILLTSACGKKSVPAPEPPPTPAATQPPPEPEPVPEAELDEEPPAPVNNVSFEVEITKVDGTSMSKRAARLERGIDWYAEDGWTSSEKDLMLGLESDSDMKDVPWTEVASIEITYGSKGDIDCMYDSNFTPWMYMCTLKTTPTAKLTDGSSWRVTSRHQWRLTFDDESSESFYIFKLPARQQDAEAASLESTENYQLYGTLQAEVLQAAKGAVVKTITLKH